jgi:hypothetical protein
MNAEGLIQGTTGSKAQLEGRGAPFEMAVLELSWCWQRLVGLNAYTPHESV